MTDCACIDHEDYGEGTFLGTEWRRARKEHKCGECGDIIKVGDRYERAGWIDGYGKGGQFASLKACEACAQIREVAYCGGTRWYGTLWEDISDYDLINGRYPLERCLLDKLVEPGASKLKAAWWKNVTEECEA